MWRFEAWFFLPFLWSPGSCFFLIEVADLGSWLVCWLVEVCGRYLAFSALYSFSQKSAARVQRNRGIVASSRHLRSR